MEIELELDETIAINLQNQYQSKDLNGIINKIIKEKIGINSDSVENHFGKVDYFKDYNYKELRKRSESFS